MTGPPSANDIIARKQKGDSLTQAEIEWMVHGAASGRVPDYQISAFLMAVYFRGMDVRETRDLTAAMISSGKILKLKSIKEDFAAFTAEQVRDVFRKYYTTARTIRVQTTPAAPVTTSPAVPSTQPAAVPAP